MKRQTALLFALPVLLIAAHGISAQERTNAVDPSGTWRWEYELNGETLKDSVQINLAKDNKVVGVYRGRSEKPVEIRDGKIKGETLTFNLTLDYQGNPLKIAFKGNVKNDDIDGNVVIATSEGDREYPWTPKRSVRLEDVVGHWQLKIETDNNTLEPTLDVAREGDKYKGRYKSGDRIDVEVTNLKVEDNQLLFSIAAEVDGSKIKGDFKGRPYGDKIKGSIAYELGDRSGDIDFTGTRQSLDKDSAAKK